MGEGGTPGSWSAVPRVRSNSEHVVGKKTTLNLLSKKSADGNNHDPHLEALIPEVGAARNGLIRFAISSSTKQQGHSL